MDSFSRYVIAFPMKNKTAEEFTTKFHDNVICVHRGSEFMADVFKELCTVHGIRQTLNSADHPTSTGLAEAGVKRIVSLLRPMIEGQDKTWDIKLPQVTWVHHRPMQRLYRHIY